MGSIMGDAQAMCELYRRMTSANTHKERQEMMDKYMAGMSPEARRRSMHMMRERCR
jgi:hypothetical protein